MMSTISYNLLSQAKMVAEEALSKFLLLLKTIDPYIYNPYPLDIQSATLYTAATVPEMVNGVSYYAMSYVTDGTQFSAL